MFCLLIWTQTDKNISFLCFLGTCFVVGVSVEIIGVNTGMLFGDYTYGEVLGFQIKNVPLLIGINWFIIIYCSGISIHTLLMKAIKRVAIAIQVKVHVALKALSVIIDGATLAVFFDWLHGTRGRKTRLLDLERRWLNIPCLNYICWFFVSVLLLTVFHFAKFNKQNKFAVNLLLVQVMFFLLLRTFLK